MGRTYVVCALFRADYVVVSPHIYTRRPSRPARQKAPEGPF